MLGASAARARPGTRAARAGERAEPLGKAEFWVLQSAGGVLVSQERHDPVA